MCLAAEPAQPGGSEITNPDLLHTYPLKEIKLIDVALSLGGDARGSGIST